MTLDSNQAIKQTVADGLGLAVLSKHTLILDRASGAFAVLDVLGFPLVRQWYALYPRGKRISVVTSAFLAYLISGGKNQLIDSGG
jgi:DNA-binding transcriptional LysR family regulator